MVSHLSAALSLTCVLVMLGCTSSRTRDDGGPRIDSSPMTDGSPPDAEDDTAPPRDSSPGDAGPPRDSSIGIGEIGSPCESHGACESGFCRTIWGPDGFTAAMCTLACTWGDTCPDGSTCFIPGDVAGHCVPTCGAAGCRPGFSCNADGQCLPANCPLSTPPRVVGIYSCCWDDDDCDSGYQCHRSTCEAGGEGRCVEVLSDVSACWEDADCLGGQPCVGGILYDLACDEVFDLPGSMGLCS